MRQHSKAIFGVVYLLLVALLISFSVAVFQKRMPWQSAAAVTLRTTAPGLELNPHSDVKFQGVLVGEVRSITSDGRTATIKLALNDSALKLLPSNIDAAIVPKTLFGEKFVDLRMPKRPNVARLAAGGSIQQSTTSVEIGAVFSNLVPVLNALRPDQLSTVLNSLAQALDGRGSELGRGLRQLQVLVGKVDPQLDTLMHDVNQFARTADVYADSAPDLIKVLSSAAGISRDLLIPKEESFEAFLDQVISTGEETKDVLSQNADALIQLSGRSRAVLALLDEYSSALPCFLKGLHTFSILGNQSIGAHGPFTNVVVDMVSNTSPYRYPNDLPSNGNNDASNRRLPSVVPNWDPHCPQFSKEVLALKDIAPNSSPFIGNTVGTTSSRSTTTAPVPSAAVQEARNALARAMAAQALGVPQDQVPGYVDMLLAPMLTDGKVVVP